MKAKMRRKMTYKKRQLVDHGYYHVIGKANNGMFIFRQDADFKFFKEQLLIAKSKFAWKLHHYCLMSSHFHLLVQMTNGQHLPRLMHFLLRQYSYYFRRKFKYSGHLWRERYRAFLILKESYLLECGRYIERNPVRASIVANPGDYPWSSYAYYAERKKDELVDENPYYPDLGKNDLQRMSQYAEFVKIDSPYEGLLSEIIQN